ncbi:MAG: phospho-N-acetylmuramoyl-pentapeptide-transferase [Oscillospiraceae bacterium]|nr:phospho-N-acetylmuramoyl-pentapeptide-transferase [Oscillospiraceae bacterium]
MQVWLAVILSITIGFGVSFLLGFVLIPWLHKLKFGQTILDIGPSWHKKKQGTPTMGGFLFIIGFALSFAAVLITDKLLGGNLITFGTDKPENILYTKIFAGILMAVGFGFIGFIDDYIKVVKKRNLGLTELQKTVLQLLVAVTYLFTLYKFAGINYMFVPYFGAWVSTVVFWIVGVIAIYCTVNAVNFLDGVDGLCASVTSLVCVAFTVCAVLRQFTGMGIMACALFGSLAGYLIWNWNPSKVMMGDVGSLFLGGMVVAMAYAIDAPWAILFIGIIYVAEFGSDIIQIAYIKTHNGKKLFKMAPIHHHYEMSGWSEKKICIVFSLITVLGSAAAVALMWFGKIR